MASVTVTSNGSSITKQCSAFIYWNLLIF
jgi:hypothetical protein